MWSSPGGWGQWPPNPLSNMSGEEVDWASLAKQWIAQRDVMSSSSVADLDGLPSSSHAAVGTLQPPPPPPPPPPSDAESFHLQVPDNTNTVDSCNSQDSGDFGSNAQPVGVPPENWENWSNPGWGMPGWVVPPPPPPVPDNGNNMFPGEHYQPVENMPPAYGFDQNFGAFYDPSFNQAHGNFQYWNAANSHHPAAAPIPLQSAHAYDFRPASKKGSAVPVNAMPSMPSLMDDNFLDLAKRRQLPAWIREGLEKMEREKLRQQEKEKNPSSGGQSGRQAGDDASRENPLEPAKSRFDSDDDSDNEVDSTAAQPEDTSVKRASPVVEEQKATVMSEEERQVQIMIRVRQMLTEVLLDVTNQEIHAMVRSVLKSAKIKQARAPAKQLAKSSALASITSLGLGYGSESESEEIEDKPSSESSGEASETSEDEDAVRLRIAIKKREFAKKMSRLEETEEEQAPSRVQQLNRKVNSDDASRLAENMAVQQHSPPNLRSEGDRMHAGDVPLANEPRHKGRHCDEVKKVAESQPTTKKRASIESASESKSSDDDDDDDESESRLSRLSRSLDDRMVGRGSANDRTKNVRVAEDSFERNSSVGKSGADSSKRKDRIHNEKGDIDKNAAIADSNRKKSNRHDYDDSYARRRSRSRDRSSGKSKRSHHKSSKKKRDESADFESHHDSRGKQLDRSVSKSSSHKSRKRSYSSSDSSDDYESHRHRRRSSKSGRDRPKQQQHRRRSSSSPEGIKGGNSGKKLHAKRKYRSSSRSSDD